MPPTPPSPDAFAQRYREGALGAFYALPPDALGAALELPRDVPRRALVQALAAYSERLGAPEAVFSALERLEHPGSRAVVTGQQAGLLLGPLYTLSKAASAVTLARGLDSEARPVLPVFWVASQDHDSREIDHALLLDLNETLHRLELPLPEGVPSGHLALEPAWVEAVCAALKGLAANAGHRAAAVTLLREAAERATSYADWFAGVLLRLLGPHGLIVCDPLEPGLAALFAPVLRAEIEDPLASSRLVNDAAERLREIGLTPQLGRAEGASNLFLEEAGRRTLLHYDGAAFLTETRRYERAELLALLETSPERLSPAAALRPVTQDAVLPSAAIVVGPGELRYFAQLRGVYERHGVAMPLVWPRAEATVLEPPVRRILDKFGLTAAEVMADFGGVRERVLLELHGHGALFADALGDMEAFWAALAAAVRDIDPTLEGTVERAEGTLEATVDRLRSKSARALAERDDIYTRQFERLRRHLLPTGLPQERVLSPFSFMLKVGADPLIAALLALPPEGEHILEL